MKRVLNNVAIGFVVCSLSAFGDESLAVIVTTTSGVYDEQTSQLNVVDQTATTPTSGTVSLVSLATFKTDVAAAFLADRGGVINFDDINGPVIDAQINASYGLSTANTLNITGGDFQVDMSAAAAIGATQISGDTYLRKTVSSTFTFNFGTPLAELGLTVLARTGARSITATVTYDDLTTGAIGPIAIPTHGGSGATSTPDTFFGFAAPAGRTISKLVVASASTGDFFVVDDLGFIIVPEPSSVTLGILGVTLLGGLRRRQWRTSFK